MAWMNAARLPLGRTAGRSSSISGLDARSVSPSMLSSTMPLSPTPAALAPVGRRRKRRAIMYEGSAFAGSSSGNVQWQYSSASCADWRRISRVPCSSSEETCSPLICVFSRSSSRGSMPSPRAQSLKLMSAATVCHSSRMEAEPARTACTSTGAGTSSRVSRLSRSSPLSLGSLARFRKMRSKSGTPSRTAICATVSSAPSVRCVECGDATHEALLGGFSAFRFFALALPFGFHSSSSSASTSATRSFLRRVTVTAPTRTKPIRS
mmetsp:Transcript_31737/g.103710  ORF Transcript_31737/g.103710 Transcript_31737/m.103710 type:complete len:265 (-) Transcript_31737:704-1498(-)